MDYLTIDDVYPVVSKLWNKLGYVDVGLLDTFIDFSKFGTDGYIVKDRLFSKYVYELGLIQLNKAYELDGTKYFGPNYELDKQYPMEYHLVITPTNMSLSSGDYVEIEGYLWPTESYFIREPAGKKKKITYEKYYNSLEDSEKDVFEFELIFAGIINRFFTEKLSVIGDFKASCYFPMDDDSLTEEVSRIKYLL